MNDTLTFILLTLLVLIGAFTFLYYAYQIFRIRRERNQAPLLGVVYPSDSDSASNNKDVH